MSDPSAERIVPRTPTDSVVSFRVMPVGTMTLDAWRATRDLAREVGHVGASGEGLVVTVRVIDVTRDSSELAPDWALRAVGLDVEDGEPVEPADVRFEDAHDLSAWWTTTRDQIRELGAQVDEAPQVGYFNDEVTEEEIDTLRRRIEMAYGRVSTSVGEEHLRDATVASKSQGGSPDDVAAPWVVHAGQLVWHRMQQS